MIALPLVVIQQNIASYPVALSNFFYLESEPHPSLGKFQETDLALRLGDIVRCRYAFVRPISIFVPRSHVPHPLGVIVNGWAPTYSFSSSSGWDAPSV